MSPTVSRSAAARVSASSRVENTSTGLARSPSDSLWIRPVTLPSESEIFRLNLLIRMSAAVRSSRTTSRVQRIALLPICMKSARGTAMQIVQLVPRTGA